jgi:hypothetical protein
MLVLVTFFAVQAFSQDATIVGTVTDPSGAAVPKAKITLTHNETGTAREYFTNNDGQYIAPNIPIGHYSLQVDAANFKRVEQANISVAVGDRSRYDFKLQIGSTSEQVTVEATAIGVQTDSSEVSNVISATQVANLAANGRSLYNLVNLTTGASSLQGDFQTPTPVGGDGAVSVNGQRVGGNLYMLDGGEDLDRGSAGGISVQPSLESIAEFRQLTSNYSAEYGLSAGATVTSVVRSGTKKFHASAWEYNRNDALDAKGYFQAKKAKLNYNNYGFNVGGQLPFGKSQPTFFFYNMEWRKLRQGGNYNVTVPLPSTYGGNFAGASSVPGDIKLDDGTVVPNSGFHTPCSNQLSAAQQALFTSAGVTLSTANASGSCGVDKSQGIGAQPTFQAWPGAAVPTSLLSPNAQLMLSAGIFPAPTNGTKFAGSPSTPTDVREEIVRIDHEFNSKNSIFGHWISEQVGQGFGTTIWSGDNVPTIGSSFNNPSYSAVVRYTRIINPRLLNEVAFNYNGNRINISPVGVYAAPSGFTFNRVFTGPNELDRMPSVALSNTGTNYQSNWMPWQNKADSYQIADDVSWTKGAHELKMGGMFLMYKKVQDLFAPTQGAFTFNGFYTGYDFADYLLGYASGYSENAVQDNGHWNFNSYALYVQDNWRATPRLTLNLGLRWDGSPHTVEANGRESNFYPNLWNPANAAILNSDGVTIDPSSPGLGTSPNPILSGYQFYLNGLGIAGKNGIPQGLVHNHWANFGPRVGFAYDLTGNGTTVVRGGFGMMYRALQGNDMYNAGPNQPFSASIGWGNVSLENPKSNLSDGTTIVASIPVGQITGLNADNYKLPVSYQYSAGVQRSLNSKTVLQVMYVGSQQRHQSDYREIELPDSSLLPAMVASSTKTSDFNHAVPYIGYHSLRMAQNEANGHYNALQVSVNGQVTRDLQLGAGYTLSRSIDAFNTGNSAGDLSNVSNPYLGWRYDVGPSYFDRTHVAFVNFVYEVPLFRNASSRAVKTLAGGWQISGIVNISSGALLNMNYGGSTSVCNVVPNCINRPDLSGSVSYPQTVSKWFDPAAFTAPAAGTWGNVEHGAVRGPGRQNWNLSLFKNFVISESRGSAFQFRADAFNVWNHTQFRGDMNGGISTNQSAPDFGQVTSAFDPRVFQLGAKLTF